MTDLFFLDFDGVICNSIDECFVSSRNAYFAQKSVDREDHESRSGPRAESVSLGARRKFERYRPFIRRGGDYVVIQYCIDEGIGLESQNDFDNVLSALGERTLDSFHRRFYDSRTRLLENDRDYWLSLNRLYPGIREFLGRARDRSVIVTTKEVYFVLEILSHHGVEWSEERAICSEKRVKLEVIREYLEGSEHNSACFIDDQIDHLTGSRDPRISVYLARWGYVTSDSLGQTDVPVLELEDLPSLL